MTFVHLRTDMGPSPPSLAGIYKLPPVSASLAALTARTPAASSFHTRSYVSRPLHSVSTSVSCVYTEADKPFSSRNRAMALLNPTKVAASSRRRRRAAHASPHPLRCQLGPR